MDLETMIGSTGVPEWILLGLFFTTFLVQGIYYLGIYILLPLYKPSKKPKKSRGISVVICARNEAHNLENFLPLVLTQDYPEVRSDCGER